VRALSIVSAGVGLSHAVSYWCLCHITLYHVETSGPATVHALRAPRLWGPWWGTCTRCGVSDKMAGSVHRVCQVGASGPVAGSMLKVYPAMNLGRACWARASRHTEGSMLWAYLVGTPGWGLLVYDL
jgi:hypothetical protein